MNTKENIKNILATKKQLDNNDIIGMVAVRDILQYIGNINTNNSELKYHLKNIYSVLDHSDSCSLCEDLEYLENDFSKLEKFAN